MPSSHSRSSRQTQTVGQVQSSRSISAPPSRPFVIILTNNHNLLTRTREAQPLQRVIQITARTTANGTNNNNNDRETLLNHLFEIELREATREYLRRTRRSNPIYYVFDMSDLDQQDH